METPHKYWILLGNWISIMGVKHGGLVRTVDGESLDWGQALCRFVYGKDWKTDPDYLRDNEIPITDSPPAYTLEAALVMEADLESVDWILLETDEEE